MNAHSLSWQQRWISLQISVICVHYTFMVVVYVRARKSIIYRRFSDYSLKIEYLTKECKINDLVSWIAHTEKVSSPITRFMINIFFDCLLSLTAVIAILCLLARDISLWIIPHLYSVPLFLNNNVLLLCLFNPHNKVEERIEYMCDKWSW